MKPRKNITGTNTRATALADIIQHARITLAHENESFTLSPDETRKIILLCIVFLRQRKDFAKCPTVNLHDVLLSLGISDCDIEGLPRRCAYQEIQLSATFDDLSSVLQYLDWHELITYALESLEYDADEYFGVALSRGTRGENKKKKSQGIYYTPTDVVGFIVSRCISQVLPKKPHPNILDCSCGSGVFLLQSLIYLENTCNTQHDFDTFLGLLKGCIWGIDISPSAVDCCKIVFLQYFLENYGHYDTQTREVWNTIDRSFFVGDATKLQDVLSLYDELPSRFDCIVGNPPYVSLGRESNLYIPFVENMMTCSSKTSSSALVLPLSVCYSQGREFARLRSAIQKDKATWTFMNYDRSPDSLFGDQVKTRSTILFRNDLENDRFIYTTTLQRWTSANRDRLFEYRALCNISDISLIKHVPKISYPVENQSFKILNGGASNLREMCLPHYSDFPLVINGTAYNWICAYDHFPPSIDEKGEKYISATTKVYYFPDEDSRDFCIALLSNRIAYWYWVATGDGFHWNASFLSDYGVGKSNFSKSQYAELCQLGKAYSKRIKEHPTVSWNAGKRIVNYAHGEAMDVIQRVEEIMITALHLPNDFAAFIEQWYLNQIYCDREK